MEPKQDLHPTSIHHSIDPTPQPTHPGSGVPRRTKAASEGLGSRKRASGTDSLEKQSRVRKEVTIPHPRSISATTLVSPRAEQSLSGSPWEQHSQLLARSHALRCGFPSSRASSPPGSSHLPVPAGMGGVAPGRADAGVTQRQKLLGGVREG